MSAEGWRDAAACRTAGPDVFWPARGDHAAVQRALAICDDCPVADDCLDYALANRIRDGVWGGLTAHARRALTPGPARAPQPARPEPREIPRPDPT